MPPGSSAEPLWRFSHRALAQLGRALEGAPITRVDAAWALTIAPACAGGVVLLGPFLLFATVMAGVNGIVLAAAAATAVLTGAALGEGLRRCGRPELSGLAVVAAAAGLWAIGGSALGGEWYEGPTGVMAGAHPPQVSLTLLATLALAGAALWLAACAMPSATGERRREVQGDAPPGPDAARGCDRGRASNRPSPPASGSGSGRGPGSRRGRRVGR